MDGLIWADTDYGLLAFVLLTRPGRRGGRCATGGARAAWSPRWLIAPSMRRSRRPCSFCISRCSRKICCRSHYYLVTLIILLAAALVGYQSMRARPDGDAIFLGLREGRAELAARAKTSVEPRDQKFGPSPAAFQVTRHTKTGFYPRQGGIIVSAGGACRRARNRGSVV